MANKNKSILIFGSSGNIGKNLYYLLRPDFEVVGTYLNTKDKNLGDYQLNLSNHSSLKRIFNKVCPDFVINATGIASPEDCEKDKKRAYLANYKSAENVTLVCAEKKIPFVYFSSDYVFRGDKANYTEEEIPDPVNYYGLTKLLGEVASREGIILRLPRVLFLNKFEDLFFQNILCGNKLALDNFRFRKFIWTYDLSQVIKRLIELEIKNGIYHICGNECLTKYQLGKLFLKGTKLNKKIKPIKEKELVLRPDMSIMSNKKIKKLGVNFTPLADIFKREAFNREIKRGL